MFELLIYVAIFGILVGGLLGLMFTIDCQKWYTKLIGTVITMVITGLIIGGACYLDVKSDREDWNNGYCSCGGQWDLVAVTRSHVDSYYVYECPDCLKTIEINGPGR